MLYLIHVRGSDVPETTTQGDDLRRIAGESFRWVSAAEHAGMLATLQEQGQPHGESEIELEEGLATVLFEFPSEAKPTEPPARMSALPTEHPDLGFTADGEVVWFDSSLREDYLDIPD